MLTRRHRLYDRWITPATSTSYTDHVREAMDQTKTSIESAADQIRKATGLGQVPADPPTFPVWPVTAAWTVTLLSVGIAWYLWLGPGKKYTFPGAP